MTEEIRKTAHGASVGADDGRSIKTTEISIAENEPEIKSFEEIEEEWRRESDPSFLRTVSMTELFDNIYRSRPPVVEGLIHRGTYLFAGAPKLGKSFLMAQIAYHVSTGTPLWGFPVRQGTVLYLALEDDYGRLQERMYRMFGTAENEKLFFSVAANQLGEGLNDQLTRFVREHPDTALVIIDTLQRVREVCGDSYSYASDYQVINQLKDFTDSSGVCLILVHHTRKQKADDAFDMISGTNGLMGAADGAFLLQKDKRTSNEATLDVSGRDQQDQKLYLVRNEEKLCWDLKRAETKLWKAPPEPLLEEVAKQINEERPVWYGSPTELCEFLNLEMKPNTLTQRLNVHAGRLMQEYGILYRSGRSHTGRQIVLKLVQRDDA